MNFTKLYYPTAEMAADDPEFIKKILLDDSILVNLAILPLNGPAEIVVTFLNQILFSGQINEELLLNLKVIPDDWLWKSSELSIQLIDNNNQSEIKLTKCLLQQIDILVYPLSELIFIKCDSQSWINTSVQSYGSISVTVTNPICLWTTQYAPKNNLVTDLKLKNPVAYNSAESDNKQIDIYLKKLKV